MFKAGIYVTMLFEVLRTLIMVNVFRKIMNQIILVTDRRSRYTSTNEHFFGDHFGILKIIYVLIFPYRSLQNFSSSVSALPWCSTRFSHVRLMYVQLITFIITIIVSERRTSTTSGTLYGISLGSSSRPKLNQTVSLRVNNFLYKGQSRKFAWSSTSFPGPSTLWRKNQLTDCDWFSFGIFCQFSVGKKRLG